MAQVLLHAKPVIRGAQVAGQGKLSDREIRCGDGWNAMPNLVTDATAGAYTITTDAILRGGYQRNGGAGDRVDTTPTGAQIDAAFPMWAIGEGRVIMVSNIGTSNKLTVTAGASGVTVNGHSAVLLKTHVFVYILKTAAATYTWYCL